MSVLVVGLSHRSAPVTVLERASVPSDALRATIEELYGAETISEVLLVSTCNRIEVYADVARFHPAVAEISSVLARHAGIPVSELAPNLYVHFAEAAVEHMFTVACGLDSLVVGESQILGQLRSAYALGTEVGSVGTVLHDLAQTALHVGKRAHAETGIDQAGASVVAVALNEAARVLGPLGEQHALVVGAGSMGALTTATLARAGAADIVVANRSLPRAERVAAAVGGRGVGLDRLPAEIHAADLVITSTGSAGIVIEAEHVIARHGRPLVILDLALPRDVDPAVAALPDVTYVDLDGLRKAGAMVSDAEVQAAADIVAEELAEHLAEQQRLAVAPTVTALRARANQVIDGELARLDARLPDLGPAERRAVGDAVRRAVEKLLHAPTVRVKELAATPGGDQYAAALRELFDLDQTTVDSVVAVKAPPSPRESA
ncbi:MAG: glutamyl-tRNA reductase [Jatrophihabitans sp.]|uniref:glutamyl-tRNA reductase n=1 Tax=Jatrophihabitans sp. TaxID=1932789 RepID=UPI003F7EC19B